MTGRFKNLLIGIFVLVAIALLVWGLLWLSPQIGDEGQVLHVRFTNIDKISPGTRVTFAGQPVGEVHRIKEINDARIDTHDGKVYIFELTLLLDSHIDVYTTDMISIRTSGLLGERTVDITPMPPQPGQPFERVTSNEILYSATGGSMEETFQQINKLSVRASKVFDQFADAMDELEGRHFWEDLSKGVNGFAKIMDTISENDRLQTTMDNIQKFSQKLNEASDKVDQMFDDISKAAEGFGDIVGSVGKIVSHVEKGEGTLGRLLVRDDFYNHVQSFMHKAEVLMDDINHYGLLFHLDKKWQRVRARRIDLMNRLCTPQEFHNFFTDEINQVLTALSRVNSIFEQYSCCYDEALLSDQFARVFADLLRRVNALEGNLKLYGEQVVEIQEENAGCGW